MHESTALAMPCTERKGIDSINQKNAVIFFRTTRVMFVDPFSTKGVLPKELLYFARVWLLVVIRLNMKERSLQFPPWDPPHYFFT